MLTIQDWPPSESEYTLAPEEIKRRARLLATLNKPGAHDQFATILHAHNIAAQARFALHIIWQSRRQEIVP